MEQMRAIVVQPRLLAYILGGFLSNTGTWVQRVAIGWLVYELTASVAWVGIVAACEVLPSIIVQPLGGVLLDRVVRSRALALGSLMSCAQAVVLAALYALGLLDLGILIVAALCLGLLEGVNQPARLTMVSEFSKPATLRLAISMNSLFFNLARFAGPLLAGVFLASGRMEFIFAFNALSFLPIIILLLAVGQRHSAGDGAQPEGFGRAFLLGLHYICEHGILRVLLAHAIIINLSSRSVIELIPAIAGYWHDNDPMALSVMTSSVAVGAILGGLWILSRRDATGILGAIFAMGVLNGLCAMAMAVGGARIETAAVACFGLGLCASGAAVGLQILVHHTVSQAHLGRSMAIYGIIQRGGAVLGAVILGALADLLGMTLPFLCAGGVAVLASLLFSFKKSELSRRIDMFDDARNNTQHQIS